MGNRNFNCGTGGGSFLQFSRIRKARKEIIAANLTDSKNTRRLLSREIS